MNYNFLYEHALAKHRNQLSQQQFKIKQILTQSNRPKTSLKSNQILTKKLFEQLQKYDDDQIISLATSLPILHSAKMIQMLKTIEQAKSMLNQNFQNGKYLRMSYEAKFVFFLWQVIGKESALTIELKHMIYLFYEKKGEQLKQILIEMASKKRQAELLYDAWRMIKSDKLYYQHSSSQLNKSDALNQTLCKQNKDNQHRSVIEGKQIRKKSNLLSMLSTKKLDLDNTMNGSLNQTSHRSIHDKLYSQNFYKKRQILMNQQKQRKQRKQLQQCTFQPLLQSRSKSKSKDKSIQIKGFDKTVNRLINGYSKTIEYKRSLQKYSRGQRYEQIKNKGMNPPQFLTRKKKENKYLFAINFQINNKKTLLKIRQNESATEAAKKLSAIYGLNKIYQQQLKQLIQRQMENHSNIEK